MPPDGVDRVALLDALPDPVVAVDAGARLVWANPAASELFGISPEELLGRSVAALIHPDDLTEALLSIESVVEKDVGTPLEVRLRMNSGEYRRFEVRGRACFDTPGVESLVLVLRDLTQRGMWQVAAGDRELLQLVLDHSPTATLVLDPDGALRGASRALTTMLGVDIEELLGRRLPSLAQSSDAAAVAAELALASSTEGTRSFEMRLQVRAGHRSLPVKVTVVNLRDDAVVRGLVATIVDVSDLAAAKTRLEYLASHDSLTGLPNRALLRDRLDHGLEVARRRGESVGVIFCDVDGFKLVNDLQGHAAGDEVLVLLAERLRLLLRASDTAARVSGDEFVVLLEGATVEGLETLVGRIEAEFAEPMLLSNGVTVAVAASAGFAISTIGGATDSDTLLQRADAAMYARKRSRSSR